MKQFSLGYFWRRTYSSAFIVSPPARVFRNTQQFPRHLTFYRKHHSTSQPQEQTGKRVSFGREGKGDLTRETRERTHEAKQEENWEWDNEWDFEGMSEKKEIWKAIWWGKQKRELTREPKET